MTKYIGAPIIRVKNNSPNMSNSPDEYEFGMNEEIHRARIKVGKGKNNDHTTLVKLYNLMFPQYLNFLKTQNDPIDKAIMITLPSQNTPEK